MRKIVWVIVVFLSFFSVNSVYALASDQARRNLTILLDSRECPNCDLSGLDLTRLDLSHTNLQGADLSFSRCNLASFAYADLKGAKLHGVALFGADMEGADLRHADLSGTDMESVFLGDALLDDRLQTDEMVQSVSGISDTVIEGTEEEPMFIQAARHKKMTTVSSLPYGRIAAKALPEPPSVSVQENLSIVTGENRDTPLFISADKKKRHMQAMGYAAVVDNDRMVIRAKNRKKKVRPDISNRQRDGQIAALQPELALWQTVPASKISGRSHSAGSIADKEKKGGLFSSKRVQPLTGGAIFMDKRGRGRSIAGNGGKKSALPESMRNRTKRAQLLRLLKTGECNGCNLAGLDLSGQSFAGASLERANLTGCKLRGTDLQRANLKAARLVEAELQQVRLDGALLNQANLSYADLTGASISDADFTGAQLTGTIGFDEN